MGEEGRARSIAVLSGKGGSGKTLIAAAMAMILADSADGFRPVGPVVLMDADVGTAGLSYYLGERYVANISNGFAEFVSRQSIRQGAEEQAQALLWTMVRPLQNHPSTRGNRRVGEVPEVLLLPMGETALLRRPGESDNVANELRKVVASLASRASRLVVDCRGGIDDESLAVCSEVDDIILVVESDTTSLQATRHLVDILSEMSLSDKIRGFILNKALENPMIVARHGQGLFRAQLLSTVPFDLDTNRGFLVGRLPETSSMLYVHVQQAVARLFEDVPKPSSSTVWASSDFERISLLTPEASRGGVLASAAILTVTVGFTVSETLASVGAAGVYVVIGVLAALGLAGSVEAGRRLLGRLTAAMNRRSTRHRHVE